MNVREQCRALYDAAFFDGDKPFDDALFALAAPFLRTVTVGEQVACMLFAVPYPIQTAQGLCEARYVYGVTTKQEFRGRGYAGQLIKAVMAEGTPLFLRPMALSLFDFYQKQGLVSFSPYRELTGIAHGVGTGFAHLGAAEYAAIRKALLPLPHAAPTVDFLALGHSLGGALSLPRGGVAFYERQGEEILFKEWLGDVSLAPAATAFLGGKQYRLRTYDENGTPFGVGAGLPADCRFLLALD